MPAGAVIRNDRKLPTGRHLVLDVAGIRHRLLFRHNPACPQTSFSVPAAPGTALRLVSTRIYAGLIGFAPPIKERAPYHLTSYRQHRLIQLLTLLDAHAAGLALRQIAFALVFPRNQPLTGAAWKGSGERRHTHRLLGEAQRMCREGYRTLLEKG